MEPGQLYRFKDSTFGRGHSHHLNGLPFLVVSCTPPGIPGMSPGVNIMVGDKVMEWSLRVLLAHVELTMPIYRVGDLVTRGMPWQETSRTGMIVQIHAGTFIPQCEVLWDGETRQRTVNTTELTVVQQISQKEVVDGSGRGGSTAAVEAGR